MRILVAGSNGLVGSALMRHLIACGHDVVRLVRRAPGTGEVQWNPDAGQIDAAGLEGFDGVVQLATMPWPMRWTDKAKKAILANRLATNGLLANALAACARKPRVLICASGMGYYGPSGDDVITEDCPPGSSFLSRFQQAGEAATLPASKAGIRVVHLRIPQVLGGQALRYAGFRAGGGAQWMSWVGLDELAFIIEFALRTEGLTGAVNAVSPYPLRNSEFAKTSTRALGTKRSTSMPAFIVRLGMGEMGQEFILASRRMYPAKLLAAGYAFHYPELADALRHEMERASAGSTAQAAGDIAVVGAVNKDSGT